VHTGLTFTTPNLTTTTTYWVGICPGSFRKPVQVTVGSNPNISGTANITNVSCAGNDGGISGLTVSGGTPNYTFSWNGNPSASANLTNANAGSYTLTVADANGCSATSGSYTITSAGGPVIDASLVNILNPTCAGANGSITGITQTGGVITSWSNSGGTNINANNLNAGSYTLTVTDASNCSATAGPFVLTAPTGPTIDATNIFISNENCGNGNGSISGITANGVSLTNSWSNSTETTLDISNLSAGSYTLTVLDNQGCSTISGPYVVESNPAQTINVSAVVLTPETCAQDNGAISGIQISGGAAPLSYSWTNTTQTTLDISNLSSGTYTLTVIDGNGCSAISNPFSIVDTPMPTINDMNILIVNESCTGNDGSISGITTTGVGLTYEWNGVLSSLNQSNLVANSYTLLVTDVNGCTVTSGPYNVSGSTPLSIDLTNVITTNSACSTNTGSITGISITGGINPVFTWSNGVNILNQNGLGAGSYTISVNDDQGCTDSETIVIALNSGPAIDANSVTITQTSCGQNNAEISGLLDNSSNSSYSWTGTTDTTLNLSNLSSGTYSLTATGIDGCVSQFGPVIINASTSPNADFSYSPLDVNPGDLVQFSDLSSSDAISWTWQVDTADFFNENPTYIFVTEGTYQVVLVVTNGAGCFDSITKIIPVYNELIIPNVITVNGDGNNDKFEIKGLEINTTVEILNRWGEIVFRSDNYLNDWNGQDMSGNNLSNGVYTYYIKTQKGELKQGFIHLID
jgi:gliding motility-associated-like protein